MELSDKELKRLKRLSSVMTEGNIAILEYLDEIDDKVEKGIPALTEIMDKVKGKDSEVPGPKGDRGDRGPKGDSIRGERGIQGISGRDGRDGKNGRDARTPVKGVDYFDGKNGIDGAPDTGEEIIDKINKTPVGPGYLIDNEHVEGFDELRTIVRATAGRVNSTPVGFRAYVEGVKKGLFQEVDFVGGSNVTITHSVVNGLNTLTFDATGGGGGNFTDNELVGTGDDTTTVFNLAATPILNSQHVYVGGIRQNPNYVSGEGDYEISGTTITFNGPPPAGQLVTADYRTT